MYIKRAAESLLKKAEKQTRVVLLTGPRQVGKSTMMRKTFPDYTYITFDDENELALAESDGQLFFRDRVFPLIIDEVQYSKNIFRTIKLITDKQEKKGQIFLTGSQTYDLLEIASRYLVGRMTILEMSSLSMREKASVDFYEVFIPDTSYIKLREKKIKKYNDIWQHIHRGCMPELVDQSRDWEWFYRDYVRTYIERDIRRIINIKDELKFRAFLTSVAARSGQILVYDNIAGDIGADIKTVKNWLSIVEASGIIKIIQSYKSNIIKRLTKAPRLYFTDTGLLCYLAGWLTPESAKNGAMSGHIFETFVVSEIIKSYLNAGKTTDKLYFYRDKDKREIDLLIESGNTLYPVEIKKSAKVDKSMIRNFSVLNKITDKEIGEGAVICLADNVVNISENVRALPIEYI